MSGLWLALGLGATTIALKAFGPTVVGQRRLPEPVGRVGALAGPVVLASLAAVLTFDSAGSMVIDGRLAGVAAALVGLWLRAPLLLVLLAAAVATAVVRLMVGT